MTEETCCTPNGQIKRYVDCKGCDRKPMTETIEQAAEKYKSLKLPDDLFDGFVAGATWQLSQQNPHRIKVAHLFELDNMYNSGKITHSRMVEILNEIAAGKHKERIEI